MVLDPILGVDSSAVDLTAYQIPLNSSPVLAPEWNPQGKYGAILHPDNIPTVFGTLQAHDNTKPGTVQSLSTDGKKNLNVNVVSGGAGSGGVQAKSFWQDGASTAFYLEGGLFYLTLPMAVGIIAVTFAATAPLGTWVYGGYCLNLLCVNADRSESFGLCSLALLPTATASGKTPMCGGSNSVSFNPPVDPSGAISGDQCQIVVQSSNAYGSTILDWYMTVTYA